MEIIQHDSTIEIKIPKKFLGVNCNELHRAIDENLNRGISKVCLDFMETNFIDSEAISTLIGIFKEATSKNALLTFKNVNEYIYWMLEVAGFENFFTIE
jgi:anti-anti-sigma factor